MGCCADIPDAARPCTDAAAQPAQQRRGLGERVCGRPVIGVQAVSRQQSAARAGDDGGQDLGHVGRRGRRRGVKPEGAGRGPREHAVEHQGVDVDVEIHRPAEALDDGDAAAAWIDADRGRVPSARRCRSTARCSMRATRRHRSWCQAST